jgi:REP element-mobilizing transposase RayT
MSTYTQILYHIVFSTKNRTRCLTKERRPEVFKYIAGVLKNQNCQVNQINGVEDHVHILASLHPTVSLSSLVKDIKLASNHFIKKKQIFPKFNGWQEGYAAFTYSIKSKERLIQYVKNQERHHKTLSFNEELAFFLKKHGIKFEMRYLN